MYTSCDASKHGWIAFKYYLRNISSKRSSSTVLGSSPHIFVRARVDLLLESLRLNYQPDSEILTVTAEAWRKWVTWHDHVLWETRTVTSVELRPEYNNLQRSMFNFYLLHCEILSFNTWYQHAEITAYRITEEDQSFASYSQPREVGFGGTKSFTQDEEIWSSYCCMSNSWL